MLMNDVEEHLAVRKLLFSFFLNFVDFNSSRICLMNIAKKNFFILYDCKIQRIFSFLFLLSP